MAKRRNPAVLAVMVSVIAASVIAGGCGSSGGTSAAPLSGGTAARASGPVDVLYAGSLLDVMERQVAPGFEAATGYSLEGFAAGSDALAEQVKGKVRVADVFISASPPVNGTLEGASNGAWESWYATFATSPLVLGYNPSSRFAHELRTKPWYQVVGEAGFLLGRTDPANDPKGSLAVTALEDAARHHREPALERLATTTSDVFPEETLIGRLQAGQLDAGFFYASEAAAASIPTVSLKGLDLGATYTVSVLDRAPHRAAAVSFVRYLLGARGRATLERFGFHLLDPYEVSGTGVPAALSGVLPSRPGAG